MVIFDLLFSVIYYVVLSSFVLLISTPLYFRIKYCAARFLATDMTDEFSLSRAVSNILISHYSERALMNAPSFMIRLTTQRQILLEELSKVNSHPTACELYEMVRKRLPRIGLGTVYRNLELMADSGMILKLELGGAQKRFDAITDPHYHVRCSNCGKMENISMDVQEEITKDAAAKTSYKILGHRVEFIGECPACQKAAAKKKKEEAP